MSAGVPDVRYYQAIREVILDTPGLVTFNGYYFTIGEVGTSWAGDYPGKVGVGGWGQTGTLGTGANVESGAQGIYATASNRLWT
ncbi:MAG: hypothetical protein ACKN9W_02750, partial [Methylococcus sp.]